MADVLIFPIVLLGVLETTPPQLTGEEVPWATAFGSYATVAECGEVMTEVAPQYWEDWPTAVFWCAEVVRVEDKGLQYGNR